MSRTKFWTSARRLVGTSPVVIDRPKGSSHPALARAIYPVDYGYLEGTTAGDGDGIDVWIGSLRPAVVTGALCTVDSGKRDAEVKLLLGCTSREETAILAFLNKGNMAAVLVHPEPDRRRARKAGRRTKNRRMA